MLKVAITGNIASGKSVAEDILKAKGFKVLDTDAVAHRLLKEDNIVKLLAETFHNYDIFENNELSRQKLGKIFFAD